SQRELARLAQAANFATRARKEGAPLAGGALHAAWADRFSRALGTQLSSVAPSVWGERDTGASRGPGDRGPGLSAREMERAARKALALAQQDKSTWTRADVVKYLGRVLPRTGMEPDRAARLI